MTATVLVLNCGSSSLKYELLAPGTGGRLTSGIVERIGDTAGRVEHHAGASVLRQERPVTDHGDALRTVLELFAEAGPGLVDVAAVGHRVVMGGAQFAEPAVIDEDLIAAVERLAPLAPLHNPANLAGIAVARELLPKLPHVAVFDTAFFHGLPAAAATYALDRETAAAHGVRRYGFHGTSHQYVSRLVAELLGRTELRQIVLHLGNGASASAVVNGVAVETSMGLTPLEGLVMGTRTGDIDPGIVFHLARTAGLSVDEIDELFNRRSGLRGLCGYNDLRDVHRRIAEGDDGARLALDVYVHRLRKYIGAFAAVMGGLDAVSFTAGVGENDAVVRAETVAGLEFLGVRIDPDRNNTTAASGPRVVSPDGAPVTVLVVPTDEEMAIAVETLAVLGRLGQSDRQVAAMREGQARR